MILDIAQIIFGLMFFLFIPGYFVVELAFKKSKLMEKVLLMILFSIIIGLIIGVFFGYDRAQAARTGGFTANNIWMGELLVTALLAFALALKRKLAPSLRDPALIEFAHALQRNFHQIRHVKQKPKRKRKITKKTKKWSRSKKTSKN